MISDIFVPNGSLIEFPKRSIHLIRNQLSHFCPNHKAAMSLRLCSKLKWPILVIFVVATIIFIVLYEVEILKMGTKITVPAEAVPTGSHGFDGSPDICGKKWQSKYQALHQDIISNNREAKFLVYYCPSTSKGCSGYGDRVRAMVSLFYLAILTDRAFLIHFKTPKPLERFLAPKNINWTFPIPLLETRKHFWKDAGDNINKKLAQDGFLTKNSSAIVKLMKKEHFKVYFDKPVEIVASNIYFADGPMQKSKYLMQRAQDMEISPLLPGSQRHAMIGCAFDVLFNTTPPLQDTLQSTRRKLRENNAFVIGIHIRLGDIQFGRNKTRISESDFPKYFWCAAEVERKLFNSDGRKHARWFLATDGLLVKDYARKHFAEKVITTEEKPQHLDIFKKGRKPPSYEDMMGVLHDHLMLAECDFLVLSKSAFGATATGIGLHSDKTYTSGEHCSLESKKHF